MKGSGKLGVCAAGAAALLGVGLMLGHFAAGENSYAPMANLPAVSEEVQLPSESLPTVNINTATQEELETLPGIGPVKAAAILAWREENGPFRYPEQMLEVSGIGEKTLENLIDLIRTEDD